MQYKILPGHLYPKDNRVNLYYLHNLFKVIGESVAQQMKQQHKISIPITAGMWGGSYMVGLDDGQAPGRPAVFHRQPAAEQPSQQSRKL